MEDTFQNSIIIRDTEYQFFHMIQQYSFDYWLREGNLTGLDLNLHTNKILLSQDIGIEFAHVDLLMQYLNICVFPTNDLNYQYNTGTIVSYYVVHNGDQIMKTVKTQVDNFVLESEQFGFFPLHNNSLDSPLEEERVDEEEQEQQTIDQLFELWARSGETTNTPVRIQWKEKEEKEEKDLEVCSICLSDESYIQTNCHHCFCDCVITHCLKNKACPLCRTIITELAIHDKKSFRILSSCLIYNDNFTLL